MAAATALKGVHKDFRYSRVVMPRKMFSRTQELPDCDWMPVATLSMIPSLAVAGGVIVSLALVLSVPVREGPEPHQQRGPEGHHHRRDAQRALHQLRVRGVVHRH